MKVVPVLAAALVIYIAIPGSNQGRGKKPKPKFCMGADGNRYKKGGSYEDKEACISYTCTKSRNKFKMKMEEIQCVGNKNNQIQKTIEDLNKHIPQPRKEGEPFVLKRTWCFWLGCANAHYYKPCCKLWQPYCKGLICRRKQKRCNSGWALVDSGCYRVVNVATFEQARAFCEDDRGSLVEITSQIEQDTLAKFYDDSLINGWVWLGAQKTQEDEWRWISSGEKMIFNSWGSGEPNNAEREENCLVWDGNESWKAVRCDDTDTNFKAICEEHKEPLPQTTDGAESVTVAPSIKPPKPCYCGIPNQRLRIVGGKKAEKHEYPWQVALVDGNDNIPFCSGSLISSETVLTAAHCTEDKEAKDISVLVGEHDVTDKSDGQRKNKVKQIIQNNLYNFETIDYDISLVILMNPVIWSKKAKPICLPKQSTNYENVKGIVSGWGTREHNGLNSDTLLETEVMTMTNKECTTNKKYKTSQITSSMICASGDGRDACHGDSGGPLVSLETGGYYSVIGVVSWGKGCADQDSPGVYSRVAHQMAWITENMVGQTCPIPQSTSGNLGWIVIQRRGQYGNAVDYFYKDFKDYENGFGSVYGELWIGLKKLAALTSDGKWELQVDLTDWDDKNYHAKYATFSVGPAPTYKLHVGGFKDGESTLGDSMDYHDGQAFSARDKDQDENGGSCAAHHKGGWWYKSCHYANLNGLNFAHQMDDQKYIRWHHGKDRGDGNKSWRASVMKIKRVKV